MKLNINCIIVTKYALDQRGDQRQQWDIYGLIKTLIIPIQHTTQ